MIRICDKAGTRWCPDPRGCALARPHECGHKRGGCLLAGGMTMRVECVEVPPARKARKARGA